MALCVNPPVDGLPLPYRPVKVSVYDPPGVLLAVVIVAVVVFDAEPLSVTELGETAHVEPAGAAPQVRDTVPAKQFTGVKVTVYVVLPPGETFSVEGLAETAKSTTFCGI